ncbi:MAG: hypothetical protein P9L99_02345 [Candidatus Lernaella stagnicola]|nr:hypothetical protein [Candidatus Lernaella stagnicola]
MSAPTAESSWDLPRWTAALLLVVVAVGFYPYHFRATGKWHSDGGDGNLHRAIIRHVAEAYRDGRFADVLDVPWHAPYTKAIYFTETFQLPGLLTAPVTALSDNPVLPHDLITIMVWALSVLAAYLLARRFGLSRLASLAAVLVISANAIRLRHIYFVAIHAVAAFLFALWFLRGYEKEKRPMQLFLALLVLLLPAFTSGYLFPTGALLFAPFVVWVASPEKLWRRAVFWGPVAAAAVIWAALYLPQAYLYADHLDRFGYGEEKLFWNSGVLLTDFFWSKLHLLAGQWSQRPILFDHDIYLGFVAVALAVWALFGLAAPRELPRPSFALTVARRLWFYLLLVGIALAAAVYFGYLFLGGALRVDEVQALIVSFVVWPILFRLLLTDSARRIWAVRYDPRFWFAMLFVLALLVVAGPFFKIETAKFATLRGRAILGNPVGLVMSQLPGFAHMRSLPRVFVFGFVALGMLAGFGLDRLRTRRHGHWWVIGAAVLLFLDTLPVFFVGEWFSPVPSEEPAPVYDYLAALPPGGTLVELPLGRLADVETDIPATFATVWHKQRLLAGYSGRVARHRHRLAALYEGGFFRELYEVLSVSGVSTILIHPPAANNKRRTPPEPPPPWRKIYDDGRDRVYRRPPPPVVWRDGRELENAHAALKGNGDLRLYLPGVRPGWFYTRRAVPLCLKVIAAFQDGSSETEYVRLNLAASLYHSQDIECISPCVAKKRGVWKVKVLTCEGNDLRGLFDYPPRD